MSDIIEALVLAIRWECPENLAELEDSGEMTRETGDQIAYAYDFVREYGVIFECREIDLVTMDKDEAERYQTAIVFERKEKE